jgi:SNF2 family DNA or RNA helicase
MSIEKEKEEEDAMKVERPKSRLRMLLESNTETQCPLCMFIPCLCPPEEEDMEDVLSNKSTRTDQANSSEETVVVEEEDSEEKDTQVVIDAYGRVPLVAKEDEELKEKENVIMVPYEIRRCLKPHQIEGIQFMYHHLKENRGCILADYMGLGKTLQVITVIYSFLTDQLSQKDKEKYEPSSVMVLCPAICIPNWEAEFKKWLSFSSLQNCPIHVLDANTSSLRLNILQQWKKQGGVLLMGYEMYRSLLNPSSSSSSFMEKEASIQITTRLGINSSIFQITDGKNWKKSSKSTKEFEILLCQPGADFVVLDEGHRMKDPCSLLCQSVTRIQTQKRLVLTGYPVQNSLSEYWCMVNFARPNFLGTYETFRSQYEKPILENNKEMSTKLMAHLKEVVLRRGKEFLEKQLPPKKEWILFCKLSTIQYQLYCNFLEKEKKEKKKTTTDLLSAYAVLLQVMNHPDIIHSKMNPHTRLTCKVQEQQEIEEKQEQQELKEEQELEEKQEEKFIDKQLIDQKDGWGWIPQEKQIEKQLLALEQSRKRKKKSIDQQKAYEWARAVMDGHKEKKKKKNNNNKTSLAQQQPNIHTSKTSSSSSTTTTSSSKRPTLYATKVVENSGKMAVLMEIIEQSFACGDKVVVFSQSVPTLKIIKEFLYCTQNSPFRLHQDFEKRRQKHLLLKTTSFFNTCSTGTEPTTKKRKTLRQINENECQRQHQRVHRDPAGLLLRRRNNHSSKKDIFSPKNLKSPRTPSDICSELEVDKDDLQEQLQEWCLQIDGTTTGAKRAEYIKQFSSPKSGVQVLLVSTKAGAEGINLHAANRLVLFDVSWNPSHDHQSMCRSHRIGQSKTVHVYRLVSDGTMERMIYEQQMKKVDLSTCVVDEQKKASTTSNGSSGTCRIFPKNLGAYESDKSSTGTTLKDFLERPVENSLKKKKKLVEFHPDLLEDDHVLKACIQEVGHWLVDIHPVHEIGEIEEEPTVEEQEEENQKKMIR